MTIATSITRRDRKRKLLSGATVVHARYVLNYRDPGSGKRRQVFCRSQREAIAKRDSLLAAIATNTYVLMRAEREEEHELTRRLLIELGYLQEGDDPDPVCSELRRKWKTRQTDGLQDFLL